jgi:PAS domain S-box-containing protein
MFEATPLPTALVCSSGTIAATNTAFGVLLGYPPELLADLDLWAVTRPDDRTWTSSYLRRLESGDLELFITEQQFLRRDGSEVRVRVRLTAMRDNLPSADDREHVVSDSERDCSSAVLAVLEPILEGQRLSDGRLQRFLEHSFSTFTVVDRDGMVLETSGRFQTLLGYPNDYWESRTIFEVLAAGELPKALALRDELTAHPGERRSVDLEVKGADGSPHLLHLDAVNLLDDPNVNGIIIVSQNVTEERRLMAELAERRASAEAVAQARSNLLATVSHELRNPLHAVQGTAELLASEHLPARAATLASSLARQISGLANVTQDLLETAQLDAGAVELHPAPMNLRELIDEVADFGRVLVRNEAVEVGTTVDDDVPAWVVADHSRLRQVLRNLVGNAVKFTEQGRVCICVVADEHTVSFSIVDTGVGIPDNEQTIVLEPFRSASTAGAGRGAGLGLSIVQRLVSAMHGEIHVSSVVGEGSTFRVTLPMEAIDPPHSELAEAGDASALVLVVEDNPVNQELARHQLDRLGLSCAVVGSGEEAVQLLGTGLLPDVLLMDHQLPGMDGMETIRVVRSTFPRLADIPAVVLTASATPADRDRFLAAGVDGFIAKPATLEDLRVALLTVLRNRAPGAVPDVRLMSSFVDLDVLGQLAEDFGDRTVVTRLVDSFLHELPSRTSAVVAALHTNDSYARRRAAHTLKSSALLVGAKRLAQICEGLEQAVTCTPAEFEALADATMGDLESWRSQRK